MNELTLVFSQSINIQHSTFNVQQYSIFKFKNQPTRQTKWLLVVLLPFKSHSRNTARDAPECSGDPIPPAPTDLPATMTGHEMEPSFGDTPSNTMGSSGCWRRRSCKRIPKHGSRLPLVLLSPSNTTITIIYSKSRIWTYRLWIMSILSIWRRTQEFRWYSTMAMRVNS